MTLLIIYILSLAALFVPFEPLQVAGTLTGICFLPGLCLFAIFKRKIGFADIILAFLSSIGISSILTVCLLYLGISAAFTAGILHTLSGLAVLTYYIIGKKENSFAVIAVSGKELKFCITALLVTFILGLPIILGTDRMVISFHGFFHSTFSSQILNGIFPPENPGLGGTRINYLWGFHALTAVLSAPANFHPLKIISILNLFSLFSVFCLAYSSAKAFDLPEKYAYLVPLAVIGLMHADSGIIFTAKFLLGKLYPSLGTQDLNPGEYYKIMGWTQKMPDNWYDTRLRFLPKFYNANAMPMAICFCYGYILILQRLIKNPEHKALYLSVNGLLIIACGVIYPPLLFVPLLHLPVWAAFLFISSGGQTITRLTEALKFLAPLLISIIVLLPYLLSVTGGASARSGSVAGFSLYSQSFKNLIVFWFSLPIIISGMWIILKRTAFSQEFYFLSSGTAACLFLTLFMRLPDNNSYKYSYILCFFFALYFVFALSSWFNRIHSNRVKGLLLSLVVLVLMSNPLIVESSYILSPWFNDNTYTLSGSHIEFSEEVDRNEAFKWIRSNTPPDTLVMLTQIGEPGMCCGENETYMPAILSERNLFVTNDGFTSGHPEFKKRLLIKNTLLKDPEDQRLDKFFISLGRPVYLLVEDDFAIFPENLENNFSLVFQNKRQRVYLIYDNP